VAGGFSSACGGIWCANAAGSSSSSSGVSTASALTSSLAGAAVLLLVLSATYFMLRRRKNKNKHLKNRIEGLITDFAVAKGGGVTEDKETRERAASAAERGRDTAPLTTDLPNDSSEKWGGDDRTLSVDRIECFQPPSVPQAHEGTATPLQTKQDRRRERSLSPARDSRIAGHSVRRSRQATGEGDGRERGAFQQEEAPNSDSAAGVLLL